VAISKNKYINKNNSRNMAILAKFLDFTMFGLGISGKMATIFKKKLPSP
jgi:hypothetical protein